MTDLRYITFALCVIVCTVFTPIFLVEQRRGFSRKSLLYKMICATCYLAGGFIAMSSIGEPGAYTKLMLAGLCLSWAGDLLLHIDGRFKTPCIITGGLCFLSAHVAFICAYSAASGGAFLSPGGWVAVIGIVVIYTMFMLLGIKIPVSKLLVPMIVYGSVLSLMLVKAAFLSAELISDGTVAGGVLLVSGALLFFLSDASIGVLMLSKKHKTNFPLKIFNIVTYFAGQLMLASTLFVIQ